VAQPGEDLDPGVGEAPHQTAGGLMASVSPPRATITGHRTSPIRPKPSWADAIS
jgi:hypothetical protein